MIDAMHPSIREAFRQKLEAHRWAGPLHRSSQGQQCPLDGDRRDCEKEQPSHPSHGNPGGCLDQDHSAASPGANVDDGIEIRGVTIDNLHQAGTDDPAIRKAVFINNVQSGVVRAERANKLFRCVF